MRPEKMARQSSCPHVRLEHGLCQPSWPATSWWQTSFWSTSLLLSSSKWPLLQAYGWMDGQHGWRQLIFQKVMILVMWLSGLFQQYIFWGKVDIQPSMEISEVPTHHDFPREASSTPTTHHLQPHDHDIPTCVLPVEKAREWPRWKRLRPEWATSLHLQLEVPSNSHRQSGGPLPFLVLLPPAYLGEWERNLLNEIHDRRKTA